MGNDNSDDNADDEDSDFRAPGGSLQSVWCDDFYDEDDNDNDDNNDDFCDDDNNDDDGNDVENDDGDDDDDDDDDDGNDGDDDFDDDIGRTKSLWSVVVDLLSLICDDTESEDEYDNEAGLASLFISMVDGGG